MGETDNLENSNREPKSLSFCYPTLNQSREATIFGQAIHALVDEGHSRTQLGLDNITVHPADANLEDVFVTLARAHGN
jgi:hypothetical protein